LFWYLFTCIFLELCILSIIFIWPLQIRKESTTNTCTLGWVEFFFTFSTSVPLMFVVSLSKVRNMKKIFVLTQWPLPNWISQTNFYVILPTFIYNNIQGYSCYNSNINPPYCTLIQGKVNSIWHNNKSLRCGRLS
jgi:hypothetical protein